MSNLYCVYHVKLPGMGLDEGYVGITNNPKRRWLAHGTKNNTNTLLKNKLRKHSEKIVREILAVFETRHEALWLEKTLRPFPSIGWNIQAGGGPSSDMSDETKNKISAALKGRSIVPMSEAGKLAWREKMVGRKISDETKKKLSAWCMGRDNPAARPVNIYSYPDNSLVASDVLMADFCKTNGLHKGHICSTAKGNLRQHKGFYARYI